MNTIEVNIKSNTKDELFVLRLKSVKKLQFFKKFLEFMDFSRKSNSIEKNKYKDLPIEPRDPNVDFLDLAGIWKGRNITLKELRKKAWGGRA
ncbi:MAG: hypothetical protein FVQ77_05435 [Cytophagales bacterium]|nr:hypothetical protein [Cytophagales bacterium]